MERVWQLGVEVPGLNPGNDYTFFYIFCALFKLLVIVLLEYFDPAVFEPDVRPLFL